MRLACLFLLTILASKGFLYSCEKHQKLFYPTPQNNVDREIDDLLDRAEEQLLNNDFRISLEKIDRAAVLLPLTQDSDDLRKLRVLFDKALVVACLEGVTENSKRQFVVRRIKMMMI